MAGLVPAIHVFLALLFIQSTDAGVPGIQLPVALGASSKLPVGLEFDGPSGVIATCLRSA